MSGFFYDLGRQVGRKAVPAIRKSKWIWDGLTGDEEESLRAETALGKSLAAELLRATAPSNDTAGAALTHEVCLRLSSCVKNKGRNFHCEVIHDNTANAMSLPGGFIFLSDSLLSLCERQPDELAFLIGHEMGHVIRGHAWKRMVRESLLRAASSVTVQSGALGAWVRQQGIALLRSAHSRDAETEADELGCRLAAAAGFAPEGALLLLQRVERLGQATVQPGAYLASHPPAAERIAQLQPLCQQLRSTSG